MAWQQHNNCWYINYVYWQGCEPRCDLNFTTNWRVFWMQRQWHKRRYRFVWIWVKTSYWDPEIPIHLISITRDELIYLPSDIYASLSLLLSIFQEGSRKRLKACTRCPSVHMQHTRNKVTYTYAYIQKNSKQNAYTQNNCKYKYKKINIQV